MSRNETLHAVSERADTPARLESRMEGARDLSAQSPEELAKALKANPKTREVAAKVLKNPDAYSEDPDVAKIQKQIYDKMGINVATDANGTLKKLMKGVVDGLVIGNAELIEIVNKQGIGFVTEKIAAQFSSLEGVRGILASMGQSVADLWSGDAYKTGKSAAEFVGVTTGLAAVGTVAKFAGKTALKASVKIGAESALRQAASATLRASATALDASGAVLQAPAKAFAKTGEVAWKGAKKVAGVAGEATGNVIWAAKLASNSGMRNGIRAAGRTAELGAEPVSKLSKAERVRSATQLNETLRARATASGVPEAAARAEAFLKDADVFKGATVSGKQADAMAERVLRAHGVAKEGERIGAYGFGSLREKLEILTAPGEGRLTSEQAKEAIRKGYAGEVRAAVSHPADALRISNEHFSSALVRTSKMADEAILSGDQALIEGAKRQIEGVARVYRERIEKLGQMRSAPGADVARIDAAHRELFDQVGKFREPYERLSKKGEVRNGASQAVNDARSAHVARTEAPNVSETVRTEAPTAATEATPGNVRGTVPETAPAKVPSAIETEATRVALRSEIDAVARSESLDWKQEFARNTAKERLEKLREPNVRDRFSKEMGFGGPGVDVSADLASARQIRASLDTEMGKLREQATELAKKYAGRPEAELTEAVARAKTYLENGGGFRTVSKELDERIVAYEKQQALRDRFAQAGAEVKRAAASPERRVAEIAELPNLKSQLEVARRELADALAPHEKRWQEIQIGRTQVENGLPGRPGEAMSRYGYGPSEIPNAFMNNPVIRQLRDRVTSLETEVRRVENMANAPA